MKRIHTDDDEKASSPEPHKKTTINHDSTSSEISASSDASAVISSSSSSSNVGKWFKALHQPNKPLILVNIWDSASAKTVEDTGAKVLATSSYAVADAHKFEDCENYPFAAALENLNNIVKVAKVPVSFDFESGFAKENFGLLHDNVIKVARTGIIGINFEDQIIGQNKLYTIEQQVARIKVIKQALQEIGMNVFLNARTDIFFQNEAASHAGLIEEAIARSHAYKEAGADGFFVPGLKDHQLIKILCDNVALPVNIMATSVEEARGIVKEELGVARISFGPFPYLAAKQEATAFESFVKNALDLSHMLPEEVSAIGLDSSSSSTGNPDA